MPGPLALAGIQLGASLAESAANAAFGNASARKQYHLNKRTYNYQRKDNLADWNMQNQYNSPAATMQRYKEAGLNPNLIYGEGTQASPAVRGADMASTDVHKPSVSTDGVMSTYLNARMQDEQMKNLIASRNIMMEEQKLKAAQTLQTVASTDYTKASTHTAEFDLAQKNLLRASQLEAASLGNEKTRADIDYTKSSQDNAKRSTDQTIQESASRIATNKIQNARTEKEIEEIKARTQNIIKDGTLKDLEIGLRKKGINPNDPFYLRAVGRLLDGETPQKILEKVTDVKKIPKNALPFGWKWMGN